MKCTIPEISWHNRDPVLSIDIQPKSTETNQTDFYRLASGGTDSHVLIWYLTEKEDGLVNLDLAADLTRHQRAVNCVRWSPSGEYLASADDESVIFIWKLKGETEVINIMENTNDQDKEIWLTFKILRGHMEDVYDLSWSPSSLNLVSGSVDNTAMIWDVQKGKHLAILSDHKSFVQGVSWDPQNQYLATLSADRYMRVFDVNTRKTISRSNKSVLPVSEDSPIKDKIVRLYHDDTLQTFYRRLSFSPDGEILVAPAGVTELDGQKSTHTSYLYTRYSLKQPAIVLPSPDQYTVAVRFCPLLFELQPHNDTSPPVIDLPYRMIFALATKSSVYLYDTQQRMPIGIVSNIHYTRLTDLTWSNDGRMLLVSSTDGFCTLIMFSDGELGKMFKRPDKDVEMKSISDEKRDENVENNSKTVENQNQDSIMPNSRDRNGVKSDDVELPNGTTNKKTELPEDRKPTPIAFRRKPRTPSKKTTVQEKMETTIETNDISKPTGSPVPIEIRHKPRTPPVALDATVASTEPKIVSPKSTPPPSSKRTKLIISDKEDSEKKIIKIDIPETIISSEEKFRSPEIKDKPVTPIQIRRAPKSNGKLVAKELTYNLSTGSPPASASSLPLNEPDILCDNIRNSFKIVAAEQTTKPKAPEIEIQSGPVEGETKVVASGRMDGSSGKTPRSNKKATPIAVRRQPRNLLPKRTPERDHGTAIEEAALDAWPIDQPKPVGGMDLMSSKKKDDESIKIITASPPPPPPVALATDTTAAGLECMDVDDTMENIRLFYDDSQDDVDNEQNKCASEARTESHVTPNSKTPRRVELRTISTPKSKKKL